MTVTEGGEHIASPIEEIVVSEPKPVANPATVGVNARMTIPTGDYSSVQIGVHLSVTVETTEIDEAFEAVSDWVSDKLGGMAQDVQKQLNED